MKDDKYFQINDMRYFYYENFKFTLPFFQTYETDACLFIGLKISLLKQ